MLRAGDPSRLEESTSTKGDIMKNLGMLIGLAPWVLFSMIAEHIGANAVGYAAALAGACSLVLAVRGAMSDGLKIIDAAGVVTFAVMSVVGFEGSHHVRQLLVDYGRGGCTVVLALVILISAYTVPFTEQYARAGVDRRYWGSPVFRATNRKISLVWAGLIAAMAAGHLIAGALASSGHDRPIVNLALNWGIPILVVVQGMRASERIAASSTAAAA
jgi:hypothetical protein